MKIRIRSTLNYLKRNYVIKTKLRFTYLLISPLQKLNH